MGSKYAEQIYSGKIKDLSLYGVLCRNAPGQQEIRESMPQAVIFPDEESLFAACGDFDAVIITTPHKEHVRVVRKAQQAGLHVLCEKPLGVTVKECEALTYDGEETVNAMVFNWRAREIYRQVYEQIRSGKLGRLTQVVWIANFWYRPAYYHHASAWRSSWGGEGGGLLINQCQHLLDMWNWLFGQPCEVSAQLGYGQYSDIRVDDKASLFFRYENGMWGTFISSSGDSPGTNRLEIHGELGRLVVEDNRYLTISENEASTTRVSETSQEMYPTISCTEERREVEQTENEYTTILQNFADAMEGRAQPLAGIADGRRALENCNAAYLSDWQRKAVEIPCDFQLYAAELQKKIQEEP